MAQPLVHIVRKRVRAKWDASKHPRDANGRFISVGDLVTTDSGEKGTVVGLSTGGVKLRTAGGKTVTVKPDQVTHGKETSLTGMREATAAERKQLKIPPAWTDVLVSDDPDAKILAVGRDQKGREQRRYSTAHSEAQAVAKFQRISRLTQELPHADPTITQAALKDDTAAATLLIRRLGLRVGSTRDTGAEKQAYGATTLLPEHVSIDGDTVTLSFTGKKGVDIKLTTTDSDIARALDARIKNRKSGEPLLATTDAQVRDYVSGLLPGFKPKDFRTLLATSEALQQVASTPTPESPKALAAAKKKVAEHVSRLLGNTPNVALASYIDPTVFGRWDAPLPVAKSVHAREAALRAHYEQTAYQTPRGLLVPIPHGDHLPDDGTPDDDEEVASDTPLLSKAKDPAMQKALSAMTKSAARRWLERLHPRGPDGRFTTRPYSSGPKPRVLEDNPDARKELGGLPRPKKYDGLDPYQSGQHHYESASPKRAAWLRRASKHLIGLLEPGDPDIEYWRGVAGLPREAPAPAPEPPKVPPQPKQEAPALGDDLEQALAAFLVEIGAMKPEVLARKARQGEPQALERVGAYIKKTARESDVQQRLKTEARAAAEADEALHEKYKTAVREFQKLNGQGYDVFQLAKGDPNLAHANTPELQAAAQRVIEVGRQKANSAIKRKKASALANSAEAAAIFEVVAQIREMAQPGDLR